MGKYWCCLYIAMQIFFVIFMAALVMILSTSQSDEDDEEKDEEDSGISWIGHILIWGPLLTWFIWADRRSYQLYRSSEKFLGSKRLLLGHDGAHGGSKTVSPTGTCAGRARRK